MFMNAKKHTLLSCQENENVLNDMAGNRKGQPIVRKLQ